MENNRTRIATLLHNPGAGDEGHSKKELIEQINAAGFECRYASADSSLSRIKPDVDFLIVAGGDGTVRKISKKLMKRKLIDKTWPVALLALGTANNIAGTLGIKGETPEMIASWKLNTLKPFDVGRIEGISGHSFFVESFGYGIFPFLMEQMKKTKLPDDIPPEEKIQKALEVLHQHIHSYAPVFCELIIDGEDHSGEYLLVEIMNIQSIGPNLRLSPSSDPGDGKFEVVLIGQNDVSLFSEYIQAKINGLDILHSFPTISARSVFLSWKAEHVHIDDELADLKSAAPVFIELRPGLLQFMI